MLWDSASPVASESAANNKAGDTNSSSEHAPVPKRSPPLPYVALPSDHDQQHQDAQCNLEQQANGTGASAWLHTAAEAPHQSTDDVETEEVRHHKIRAIFGSLNAKCDRISELNEATGFWECPPDTELDDQRNAYLRGLDWQRMIGRSDIASIAPKFYPMEPDNNQQDKPRLDLLVTLVNGESVRYHPGAHPIWSKEGTTDAMQKRLNRRSNILKKFQKLMRKKRSEQ